MLLLETFFANGIAYKFHNFEARIMGCILFRSESFALQMLLIALCDSGMLWEIFVDL